MSSPVITRFAPSPTGFLHIGGARTALFNWLYAKHTGGKMLLRIEDTDRERSTEAAISAIIDGLKWLGLDWDGEPIFQFARLARHREVAEQLVAAGQAYYAYDTPEELEEMRARAKAAGGFARYGGRWRDRDPAEAPSGVKPVVRIKSPIEGETIVDDKVLGRVAIPNKDLEDFVVLRSDGTPTYMLAVVVDDHDMGVTHIIRGVEHLTNGGRQKIIYEALGWNVPEMAHIPLIHGPDGAKLSKRHGALGVEAYRAMGYLPEALRNYLARLGWSHGDDEIFSSEQAAEWFDLDAINKGPARFDFEKLRNVNAHYMKATDNSALLRALEAILPNVDGGADFAARLDVAARVCITQLMPAFKERAKTLVELFQAARFLVASRPIAMDEKAATLLDVDARALLGRLVVALSPVDWSAPALEDAVRKFGEAEDVKLGKVAQPLRAALTGSAASPPIFDVLVALGREESLARLSDQMA